MAYPGWCEGCDARYADFPSRGVAAHVTLAAEDGGTASPWVPDRPGRVLQLGCKLCGAIFRWDYFARAADGRLGAGRGLIRGPQADWNPEHAFNLEADRGLTSAPHRRAS